jgi:carboxyl-terminal processing protease
MQKPDEPVVKEKTAAIPVKKTRTVGLFTAILIAVVVGMASFIGGTRAEGWLASLKNEQNSSAPDSLDLSSVQEVYRKLRANYDGELDPQKLVDGAKKGLVTATGDPYSVYFTDEEAKQFNDDLAGKFSGIGAEIGTKDGNLIIVTTLDDSPARKAGLQTNDIIGKVNEDETTGWSVDQAVSKIRGEKGTTVKLTILRGQDVKEF